MVLPVDNPTKSYWIEAAESRLRDLRSTTDVPATTDVVIVGSGYTGAATAYWLHKYTTGQGGEAGTTPRMLLLEARDVCGGATGRNGGQLRPHAYSRYPAWRQRFGPAGALALIQHEMAHLAAFRDLLAEEHQHVSADDVAFRLGETFDAAMTPEAWERLRGAYEALVADHGHDVLEDVGGSCRLVEDPVKAAKVTQMKGCVGAVVHPAGQVWPYKFVHALLNIVLKTGRLNVQAHTPVVQVSNRDGDGWITVTTSRGVVRTRAVVHATNRWAAHVLPEFDNLVAPGRATLAAIRAPAGFTKRTGAQHWDSVVNNYHVQLPPPHNAIVVGGAKQVLVHDPRAYVGSDAEDRQFPGVPAFYQTWPASDIVDWPTCQATTDTTALNTAELARPVDQGGVWTGITGSSIDAFPFVGAVPGRDGHFVAAAFSGHGMPRILLSAAHLAPLVLESLGTVYTAPALVASYPPLPNPFLVTAERMERLRRVDAAARRAESVMSDAESARKPFCNDARVRACLGVEA